MSVPILPSPAVATVPAIALNYAIWGIAGMGTIVAALVGYIFTRSSSDLEKTKKELFPLLRSIESNISGMAKDIAVDNEKIVNNSREIEANTRTIEDHTRKIGNLENKVGQMETAIKPLL